MRLIAAISLFVTTASAHADAYWVLRSYVDDIPVSDTTTQAETYWDLDYWDAGDSFCVEDSSTGKCIGVTASEACRFMRDRYALQSSETAQKAGQPSKYTFKCKFVTVYND